ncbi:MAG: transporter, family, putative transporter [Bacteroidales bacterium]|jgi:YQGE family putative transporter|nr:transporter, family, putative transporter [Bacteroidales bacterium]
MKVLEKFYGEYRYFQSMPHNMRVLLVTNMLYSMVLPVVEVFLAAYIMRYYNETIFVALFQLAMYSGIVITSVLNGFFLRKFNIAHLYTFGILLSGVTMLGMMQVDGLTVTGLFTAGLLIGASSGFFWTNRYLMTFNSTEDTNRNYFFGLESFFFTVSNITIPLVVGAILSRFDGLEVWGITFNIYSGYRFVTVLVFLITILAGLSLMRAKYSNPEQKAFLFFKFHKLWNLQILLAALKGLVQGFLVTAPAMLIMRYVGKEGSLGLIQGLGGGLTALIIYLLGRFTKPIHRLPIFSIGLSIFLLGTLINAWQLTAMGVIIFLLCKVVFQPLHDLAYYPIMLKVIDTVSVLENRNPYAYILNHEFGLYVGRFLGLIIFITLALKVSETFALQWALVIVAALQMLSIPLAFHITNKSYEL